MRKRIRNRAFFLLNIAVFVLSSCSTDEPSFFADDSSIDGIVAQYNAYEPHGGRECHEIDVSSDVNQTSDALRAFSELINAKLPDSKILDGFPVLQTKSGYIYTWAGKPGFLCILIAKKGSNKVFWMPVAPG